MKYIFACILSILALTTDATTGKKWALPCLSVANMRSKPSHAAELSSQVVMGTPLQLIESSGDWWLVESPDGYKGWINRSSLKIKNEQEMNEWRSARRAIVSSTYQTRCYASPASTAMRDVVSDLVNGNIVEIIRQSPDSSFIMLPDGRKGWVSNNDITDLNDWADQTFNAERILNMAYSMIGQPYLWGGTSTKSLDCSGLVKVCFFDNGIILRRDASQQAQTGSRIEASDWRSCQPGDLLFFGNAKTKRVTHVGIYDHDGYYVHSSGMVKRNSIDPASDMYLSTTLLHCTRIAGCEGTDGIIQAKKHPWYFNL